MSSVTGFNNFNNLLYSTKRRAVSDYLEHKVGKVGPDLSYKGNSHIADVLSCRVSQLNGKHSDLKYKPKVLHSRPYYGFDARFDPTILNAVRNRYIDVSGLLVLPKDLSKNRDVNRTFQPLKAYGIVR